jgi:predicted ABC-type ATPase
MSTKVSRLRMFAGPNGSGKSTFNQMLSPELLGRYVNADEIQKEITQSGCLNVRGYGIECTGADILGFIQSHDLTKKAELGELATRLTFEDGMLWFREVPVNAYFAAVVADFLRHRLLEQRESFTFETVMSSPDKVELVRKAQALGYRTYLYFVATEDPEINVSRVRNRVLLGGHDVPEDKIVSRYARSLGLLMEAIRHTNRAYIFDNSEALQDHQWLAEVTDGKELELKTDQIPAWFQRSVLDKIASHA